MTDNTAAKAAPDEGQPISTTGFECGAEESTGGNHIYVSLRTGKICQHDKNPLRGYKPARTTNKDGSINNFFAKEYDHVTGYVTALRWDKHTLPNGTVLSGWNLTIDTTKEAFVLKIGTADRPFERFMSTILGVDFDKPLFVKAFMGKNRKTERPEKVLLLSQEKDAATGKPIWLKPVVQEKWLSRELIDRCKAAHKKGIAPELSQVETDTLSWNKDGSINWQYPYITQGLDDKWSLDAWRSYLMEQIEEFVMPNIQAANLARGPIVHAPVSNGGADEAIVLEDDATEYTGPPAYGADDDIPF